MSGYIKFFRDLRKLSCMQDSCMVHAMVILLTDARYMPSVINGIPVERGQLVLSLPEFCDEMNISRKTAVFILDTFRKINGITYSPINNNKLLVTLTPVFLTATGITRDMCYIKGDSPEIRNESPLFKEANKTTVTRISENKTGEEYNEKEEEVLKEEVKEEVKEEIKEEGKEGIKKEVIKEEVIKDTGVADTNEKKPWTRADIDIFADEETIIKKEEFAKKLNSTPEERSREEQRIKAQKEAFKKKKEQQEPKKPYGKFKNVLLTDKEYEELQKSIKEYEAYIEKLSAYIASSGRTDYHNHHATLHAWHLREQEKNKGKTENKEGLTPVRDTYKELYPTGRSYDLDRAVKRSLEETPKLKMRNPETGQFETVHKKDTSEKSQ